MSNNIQAANSYEQILLDNRGYVAKWPADKTAVMIISGGLDSITMSAKLLKDGYTLYPLHIQRGQQILLQSVNLLNTLQSYLRTNIRASLMM